MYSIIETCFGINVEKIQNSAKRAAIFLDVSKDNFYLPPGKKRSSGITFVQYLF